MGDFDEKGCAVVGVSTDSIESHQRWLTTAPAQGGLGALNFPLASDEEGSVCRRFGVYIERQNLAQRGLFIIDPNGVLQYQVVHSLSVGRSSDEVLRVLDALQNGGLCPGERLAGGAAIDVLTELRPNRVIGQYRVESEIGSGTFGTVFRAIDKLLDRPVALKVLRSNGPTDKLLAEARAAAALTHPNVCAVHAVDASSGAAMIVMEYVDGESVATRLKQGPLDEHQARDIVRQVAEGMAAAHTAGVVHGDLKPANLMLTAEGVVKIMDFGLARRIAPETNSEDTVELDASSGAGLSGTPAYMAPEVVKGEVPTPDSDVFALGLILYELVSGRAAVSGPILEVLRQIERFEPARLISEVPDCFKGVLQHTLIVAPAENRISMSEFSQRLI